MWQTIKLQTQIHPFLAFLAFPQHKNSHATDGVERKRKITPKSSTNCFILFKLQLHLGNYSYFKSHKNLFTKTRMLLLGSQLKGMSEWKISFALLNNNNLSSEISFLWLEVSFLCSAWPSERWEKKHSPSFFLCWLCLLVNAKKNIFVDWELWIKKKNSQSNVQFHEKSINFQEIISAHERYMSSITQLVWTCYIATRKRRYSFGFGFHSESSTYKQIHQIPKSLCSSVLPFFVVVANATTMMMCGKSLTRTRIVEEIKILIYRIRMCSTLAKKTRGFFIFQVHITMASVSSFELNSMKNF